MARILLLTLSAVAVTTALVAGGCRGRGDSGPEVSVTGRDNWPTDPNESVNAVLGKAYEAPGALRILDENGEQTGLCPLKHTDVKATVSGFVARVEVNQQFHNPYDYKIEAVYTFPLSQNAAVDDMLMVVGDRRIRGEIKERGEARRIYDAAKAAGHVASLLDQERPNIFTQSVANIEPGEGVEITISYVELLDFEDGWFEFVFPTVVGPRYIPGSPTSKVPDVPPELEGKVHEVPGPSSGPPPSGTGWAPDTDQVPDASRITPPVAKPGVRPGHDISIEVTIDAGRPISQIESELHEIDSEHDGQVSVVRLKDQETIPNKDFILRYTSATDEIEDVVLTHAEGDKRFLAMVIQPPKRVKPDEAIPKELVFVVDTSGSMSGDPIEKAKETMFHCLENLNPKDTFNLITFSGDTRILFSAPVKATKEHIDEARSVLEGTHGSGGTEMMKAIRAALEPSDSQQHVRIVTFMTDGYVGNDMEIVDEIQKHPNARIFSFGIGQSPNRYLLDKMAYEGRGEVDYVSLGDSGEEVAERFYERMRSPVLTDIEVDWGGLPVKDVLPARIPDLYSAKPVVIYARFTKPQQGGVTLRGDVAGKAFKRTISLDLPEERSAHAVLAPLWARQQVDYLMNQDLAGIQGGSANDEIKQSIIDLGLEYRIMTQFTSFVAVEELVVTEGGETRTIPVPVEMPEGVSHEGVFGPAEGAVSTRYFAAPPPGAMAKSAAGGMPAAPMDHWSYDAVGDAYEEGLLEGYPEEDAPGKPEDAWKRKLSTEVAELVEKLEAGEDVSNLKIERLVVQDGVVELSLWLSDDSDESIDAIEALGAKIIARSKAAKMVIIKLKASRLEELAKLDCVSRIEAPPA